MEEFLAWLFPLIGTAIISTVVGIVIKGFLDKKFKQQEELTELRDNKLRAEREQVVKTIVTEAISQEMTKIDACLEKMQSSIDILDVRLQKVGAGSQATLRNDLLTCYYRCYEKGYRTAEDIQNWNDMYEAYKALNGNSFIDDIRTEFSRIPSYSAYKAKLRALDNENGAKNN